MDLNTKRLDALNKLLDNMPKSWVELTTHRLDIYDEAHAKSDFLSELKALLSAKDFSREQLDKLPTAYDYIRLGHQLSSVLELVLAELNDVPADQVITFASKTMPILAVLRRNALSNTTTYIYHNLKSSPLKDESRLTAIYGYQFEVIPVESANEIPEHPKGTVLYVTETSYQDPLAASSNIHATINLHPHFGSAMLIHDCKDSGGQIENLVKDIQHVRRRESIAMTPPNALNVLNEIVRSARPELVAVENNAVETVSLCIQQNTGSTVSPLVASSGLSIQYAMMMGLIENAITQHPSKPIAIILPPNCYGGTNDQARRIADLIPNVSIVDLLVDGGQELVHSLDLALTQVASDDAVPLVLAEIPTNPRVEVPNMHELARVLKANRTTSSGNPAVKPTFMVDQTFCPNVKLLGDENELAAVKVISFSSGSKFPSGGRCIAGYCAANNAAKALQLLIAKHLDLSDNNALPHQLNTLAENMPSMPARIKKAYQNTLRFVNHIKQVLPDSKINFVSEELAAEDFTPSVFSLDLPTVGDSKQAREDYKRNLNEKLIDFMIKRHPDDCKHCVSYGQLKGSYWTIPATSTQGTTKETDKDYIVRVALAPEVDVAKLCDSFSEFFRNEGIID